MSGLLSSRPSFVTVLACAAVVSLIFCSHAAEAYPTIVPVESGVQPVLRSYKATHRPFVHSQNTEPSGFVAPNNGNANFNWHFPIIRNSPNIQQERPLPQSASQSYEQFPKSGSATLSESRTKDKTAWQSPDYSPISYRTGRYWSSHPTSKGHDSDNNNGFAEAGLRTSTSIQSQSSKFPSFSRQNGPVSSSGLDTNVFKTHLSPEKLTSSVTHFSQGVFPASSDEKQNNYMKVQSYLLGNSQISDKPKGVIAASATHGFQDNVYRGHDFSQQTETGQSRTRPNLFNANSVANANRENIINYQPASVIYRAPPIDTPEKFEEANNRNAKDAKSGQVYAVPRGPIQQTETNQARMRPSLFTDNSEASGTKVNGGNVINYQPASVIYRAPPRKDAPQKYEEASSANINAKGSQVHTVPGRPSQQTESSYPSNGQLHWNLKKNSQQLIISNREANPEPRGYRFMHPSSLQKYSFGQRIASSTLAPDKRTSAVYSRDLLDATSSTTPKSSPFHQVPGRSVLTNGQNELKIDPKPRVYGVLSSDQRNVPIVQQPKFKAVTYHDILGSASFSSVRPARITRDRLNFDDLTTNVQKEMVSQNWTVNLEDEVHMTADASSENGTEKQIVGKLDCRKANAETLSDVTVKETESEAKSIPCGLPSDTEENLRENQLELDYLHTSTGNVSFQSLNLNL